MSGFSTFPVTYVHTHLWEILRFMYTEYSYTCMKFNEKENYKRFCGELAFSFLIARRYLLTINVSLNHD